MRRAREHAEGNSPDLQEEHVATHADSNFSARSSVKLEPIVCDTPAIAWQVFERIQSVKVIDGDLRDGLGIGKAQIDSNAAATLRIDLFASPEGDAATRWTKVEFKRLASGERLSSTGDRDAFVLVVVCPKHSVPPARGAIACCRPIRLPSKLPVH